MTVQGIDVEQALENAEKAIAQDAALSASSRAVFEVLIMLVSALLGRTQRNSRNSHTPPSADSHRAKCPRSSSKKPRGGQPGHAGATLEPVDTPDEVPHLSIDRRMLPPGRYTPQGFEKRQVMDIEVFRWVTEYQAEVLVNEHGQRYVAEFPEGVTRPIRYGPGLKAHAVYLSQYQLLPYERIGQYFADQLGVPLSAGSLARFNEQAGEALRALGVPALIAQHLRASDVLHADETSINIGGKKIWLHSVSSAQWTLYTPHAKRGREAVDEAGVLPGFHGIVCHDHWKSYYTRTHCQHSLCNAHHLRELTGAPFTNNLGERDLRMMKVQQKISGCFRSLGGAETFCVIRSYLSSCRKQAISAAQAMSQLFSGRLHEEFSARAE